MQAIELNKGDIRSLLLFIGTLPVICFAAGLIMATGIQNKPVAIEASNVVSQPESSPVIVAMEESDAETGVISRAAPPMVEPQVTQSLPERSDHVFLLQAGVFRSERNAKGLVARLSDRGLTPAIQNVDDLESTRYRVILGAYRSREDAEVKANTLRKDYKIGIYLVQQTGNSVPGQFVAAL